MSEGARSPRRAEGGGEERRGRGLVVLACSVSPPCLLVPSVRPARDCSLSLFPVAAPSATITSPTSGDVPQRIFPPPLLLARSQAAAVGFGKGVWSGKHTPPHVFHSARLLGQPIPASPKRDPYVIGTV